jgi:hypothetical protein
VPRKRNPVIVAPDALDELQFIIAELNRTEGNQKDAAFLPSALELRGIVKKWQDSGPNLWKLYSSDWGLWVETQKAFKPMLMPTKSGSAHIHAFANAGAPGVLNSRGKLGIRTYALIIFNSLTINPLWKKLGGPCARCEKYFLKKRANQFIYCARRCASLASAETSTRERLDNERTDKLTRASASVRAWDALRKRPAISWKEYVSQAEKISKKWLTRAVNRGELVPPKEGSDAKG